MASTSNTTNNSNEEKIVSFDRNGFTPNIAKDLFIAFCKSYILLKSKLQTPYFLLDLENTEAHFKLFMAADLKEKKYLTEEKNEYLDKLPGLLTILLSKGRGNVDEDDKETCKVASKVVKICAPYEKGEKRLDNGDLNSRYSRGLKISEKLEAIGDEKLALIGAVDKKNQFKANVDGYNDTKDVRDAYYASIKGEVAKYKAEIVADILDVFNGLNGVQRKTKGAENTFVRQLMKLITNTQAKLGKGGKSSGTDTPTDDTKK